MTKPSLIILGHDPAEPEQDIPSAASFTGNECETPPVSCYSAEDIKRELRRLISERIPTHPPDFPDPLNLAPINRPSLNPAALNPAALNPASDRETQARAEWTNLVERSRAEVRRLTDPANISNPEHRARIEAARAAPAEAIERAREILSAQALSANLIPHASIRPSLLFNALPFGEDDP